MDRSMKITILLVTFAITQYLQYNYLYRFFKFKNIFLIYYLNIYKLAVIIKIILLTETLSLLNQ